MAEAKSAKKRLLILGSGFSKAVSEKMPVVRKLADELKKEIKRDDTELKALNDPQYKHLLNDPELLLTYLSQDQPWKKPDETHGDRALFLRVSKWLAKYIEECEDLAFKSDIPKHIVDLAQWLHKTKTPVITFNYDTVLERVCYLNVIVDTDIFDPRTLNWTKKLLPLCEYNLYQMPLAMIPHRTGPVSPPPPQISFHLVKLHGSINWFYSGGEQFPGEQVYFRSVDSKSPSDDMTGLDNLARRVIELIGEPVPPPPPFDLKTEINKLLSDKTPLIIPPVAEKSRFYSNQAIRSLWGKAREHLKQAEEIYCIGYSLPDTDLTTKLLFQTACAGQAKTVYIVNNAVNCKDSLLRRYWDAFPQRTTIKDDYIREDAVEAMVDNLCKEEEASC